MQARLTEVVQAIKPSVPISPVAIARTHHDSALLFIIRIILAKELYLINSVSSKFK